MSETPLPPLYSHWIDSILGSEIPPETRATCASCAMSDPALPEPLQFAPGLKCCTFQPRLRNFLVGMILADTSIEAQLGREMIVRQVRERLGATPLGISPSRSTTELYESRRVDGFGRDRALLCSYFNGADVDSCGIWRYRNAVCGTFFCKSVRGAAGLAFWSDVKNLLVAVEEQLATWCAFELKASSTQELFDHSAAPLGLRSLRGAIDADDGRLSVSLAIRLWGDWYGRETEFYLRCADRVRALQWNDIVRICGVRVTILEQRVRDSFEAMNAPVPLVLCKTNFASLPQDGGDVIVRSIGAPLDMLRLASPTVDALVEFDGRPNNEVLDATSASGIDAPLLRTLFERGVLLPPNGRDVPKRLQPSHPLQPDDSLSFFRSFSRLEATRSDTRTAEGREAILISVGHKEVEFDEPELFEFARRLFEHQYGFRAEDAKKWTADGGELAWERVGPLLQALLDDDILQRLPVERAPSSS